VTGPSICGVKFVSIVPPGRMCTRPERFALPTWLKVPPMYQPPRLSPVTAWMLPSNLGSVGISAELSASTIPKGPV